MIAFFSHRRRTLLLPVYVFSFRHHSLSLHRRSLLFLQQHSLSLLRRSLARSVCSDVPAGCSVRRCQLRTLLGSRLISLLRKSVLQQVGRPRARRRKGPSDVDRVVLRAVTAAAPPPPILLLAAALTSYKVLVKVEIN
jgi:hypothetical protein